MPSGIVYVQAGQCGNQIGQVYWDLITEEHGIDEQGAYRGHREEELERVDTCFNETPYGRLVPRAILVDLEPGVLDMVKASRLGGLFRPDNFIYGRSGAGNNWAKGFYTDGAEVAVQAMEAIRKEAEHCDALQGFQIMHAVGGGTGGGLGSLLLTKIREEYGDRISVAFSVYPSAKDSAVVVEPYNAILSTRTLLTGADTVQVMDNAALHRICSQRLQLQRATYEDFNRLIASCISSVTCGLRFPGQLNGHLRKTVVNLVPFPRLHFLFATSAPLLAFRDLRYHALGETEVVPLLFDASHSLLTCTPQEGRVLTAAAMFRGLVSLKHVEQQLRNLRNKYSENFVDWIPHNLQTSVCESPLGDMKLSATLLCNSSSIRGPLGKLHSRFEAMHRRRAFLHWYSCEGMDDAEFWEAAADICDLLDEYAQHEVDDLSDDYGTSGDVADFEEASVEDFAYPDYSPEKVLPSSLSRRKPPLPLYAAAGKKTNADDCSASTKGSRLPLAASVQFQSSERRRGMEGEELFPFSTTLNLKRRTSSSSLFDVASGPLWQIHSGSGTSPLADLLDSALDVCRPSNQ